MDTNEKINNLIAERKRINAEISKIRRASKLGLDGDFFIQRYPTGKMRIAGRNCDFDPKGCKFVTIAAGFDKDLLIEYAKSFAINLLDFCNKEERNLNKEE